MAFLERDADFNVSRTAGARRRMRQRRDRTRVQALQASRRNRDASRVIAAWARERKDREPLGLRGQDSAASVNGRNRASAAALHSCTRSVVSGLRSHWICRPSIIATICLASSSGRSVSCSASAA